MAQGQPNAQAARMQLNMINMLAKDRLRASKWRLVM